MQTSFEKKVGQAERKPVDSPEEIVLGINFSIYILFFNLFSPHPPAGIWKLLRISKIQWALQREGKEDKHCTQMLTS